MPTIRSPWMCRLILCPNIPLTTAICACATKYWPIFRAWRKSVSISPTITRMIEHMDAKIGQVLAALEASGRADDTIVVYTADHGLAVGQHGLMGEQDMLEHSVSVPLVVRGEGVPL